MYWIMVGPSTTYFHDIIIIGIRSRLAMIDWTPRRIHRVGGVALALRRVVCLLPSKQVSTDIACLRGGFCL